MFKSTASLLALAILVTVGQASARTDEAPKGSHRGVELQRRQAGGLPYGSGNGCEGCALAQPYNFIVDGHGAFTPNTLGWYASDGTELPVGRPYLIRPDVLDALRTGQALPAKEDLSGTCNAQQLEDGSLAVDCH